jgi:CBS domain-containing protein
MNQEAFQFLTGVPVFAALPREEIEKVANAVTVKSYAKDHVFAIQGQTKIDSVYVVQKGSFSLFDEKNGNKKLAGFIKPGEVFGGITILMNAGISLRTVVVDQDIQGYMIAEGVFRDLCNRYATFYEYFLENFSKNIFDESLITLIKNGQTQLFLSGIVPFSFLPEEVLKEVSSKLSIVRYPKDTIVCRHGESTIQYLYIVQKGAAERFYEKNKVKTLSGLVGEGDIYGGISMLVNQGTAVRSLRTTEDTYFYLLPKEQFMDLCEAHEVFSEYFTDTFGKRMLDRSYAAIITKTTKSREESLQFFNQSVAHVYNPTLVACPQDDTVQQAAEIMNRHRCSSIFIKDAQGEYIGIVTDNDLRKKVIAQGINVQRPVADIMSTPLHTIPEKSMIFETLMTMMQLNVKHLAVTDMQKRIIGAVTNHDLLVAQARSPFFLLREIKRAENKEALFNKHAQLPAIIQGLITGGAKSENVTRLITTISDAILKKLIGFALAEMPEPPARFVFIILGSEGRMEQTLKTDQDNAIIYEDVDEHLQEDVHKYFLELGEKICNWLDMAGYAFCEGGIMAKNSKWCQPMSVWKKYFHSWIRTAEPQDLLQSSIFFDFRGAHGDMQMVDNLRKFLFGALKGWSGFFRHLTENALHFKPPIGFFRNFVVESKGKHRNSFDIKSAMMPIVDLARIYALNHQVIETNTRERIHSLYLKKVFSHQEYNEIDKAYSFLMQLRFVRQINAVIEENAKPDNYINPKKLSRIEQKMLKEIFARIEKFQERLDFDFTGLY